MESLFVECVVTDGIYRNLTSNFSCVFILFICQFSHQYDNIPRTGNIKQYASTFVYINCTASIVLYLVLLVVKICCLFLSCDAVYFRKLLDSS